MTMVMAPISTRNQFGQMLNDTGLLGEAAEVGTHRADFAELLLDTWRGRRLWCVDPWSNPPGYERQAKALWGGGDRFRDFQEAHRRLFRFGERAEMLRMLSATAVESVPDGLSFVHLDGNHEPPYVAQDLELWWPKVAPGGVLAGHDFLCPGEIGGGWGQHIQPAVLDFVGPRGAAAGLDVQLVVEENGLPWTYYIIKPGGKP